MALSKKTKKVNALVDRTKLYSVEDAVAILLTAAKERKYNETIEIAMNLGVDPRQNDQVVRGVTELPHGTGAVVRVAVFAKGPKAEEAKKPVLTLLAQKISLKKWPKALSILIAVLLRRT